MSQNFNHILRWWWYSLEDKLAGLKHGNGLFITNWYDLSMAMGCSLRRAGITLAWQSAAYLSHTTTLAWQRLLGHTGKTKTW